MKALRKNPNISKSAFPMFSSTHRSKVPDPLITTHPSPPPHPPPFRGFHLTPSSAAVGGRHRAASWAIIWSINFIFFLEKKIVLAVFLFQRFCWGPSFFGKKTCFPRLKDAAQSLEGTFPNHSLIPRRKKIEGQQKSIFDSFPVPKHFSDCRRLFAGSFNH